MNLKIITLSFIFHLLLVAPALLAQITITRLDLSPNQGCNFDGAPLQEESIYGFEPSNQAQAVIDEIMSRMGLSSNFQLMAANVDNALAHVQGGQRFILYNERFMNHVFERTADYWASVSILAHEIGHHLNGHTLTAEGSRPELELAADQFSGFVLYKLGATQVQAELAVQALANDRGTSTHPPKSARLQAITVGYRDAEEEVAKFLEEKSNEREQTFKLGNNEALIGGEKYPTVRLNGLTWVAKNLNYKVDDSWCYDNDPVKCYSYGRLYTWKAALKACEEVGWRLPTDEEWGALVGSLGGYDKAFQALKEGGDTDFNAQLGGLSDGYRRTTDIDWSGYYWSATEENKSFAWCYEFVPSYYTIFHLSPQKVLGFSCRCVQD